ncbi:MAG: hypothetical protein ABII71_05440 [Candidatus Micrarchaeota archaeon]
MESALLGTEMTDKELQGVKGFGHAALGEIKKELSRLGLKTGMEFDQSFASILQAVSVMGIDNF